MCVSTDVANYSVTDELMDRLTDQWMGRQTDMRPLCVSLLYESVQQSSASRCAD